MLSEVPLRNRYTRRNILLQYPSYLWAWVNLIDTNRIHQYQGSRNVWQIIVRAWPDNGSV